MPVFQETADASRDLRILPSLEAPLPRLTPQSLPLDDGLERLEVAIIGAGPAGMMLTLLLARYGLGNSITCFDSKPGTLKAGQADGLQPRTLEILKSLDIADEILNHGCHMEEVAFWNPSHEPGGIERTSLTPDVAVPARFPYEVTIHQGRIERILENNLNQYSSNNIARSTNFINFEFDVAGDPDYPVLLELEQSSAGGETIRKKVRSKYVVGADGAHSRVRQCMGLNLQGETTDHIWGVVDFVADTNFPDIRKRCAIHSDAGSVMVIPRERIRSGHYLTRLYVQIKDVVPADDGDDATESEARAKSRNRRGAITLEYIIDQAQRVLCPYKISVKKDTKIDWWAAYQIGQRMTDKFSICDGAVVERIFIAGDACHTHSPKAGQGMNVSMMDSYNLAWKLVHHIHGLSPPGGRVLSTYNSERVEIARMLIEFDTKFSSMFSGSVANGDDSTAENITHEQFLKVFSDGNGFSSGCGYEYAESTVIQALDTQTSPSSITGSDYISGVLRQGRRLLDSKVRRYADANARHLQDDFSSDGRFRILVFSAKDLQSPGSESCAALNEICNSLLPSFPAGTVGLVVLHPFVKRSFEWSDIPDCVKEVAEMSFHGPIEDGLYGVYGVNEELGALVVVRPDGVVGAISSLSDTAGIDAYLGQCLVKF